MKTFKDLEFKEHPNHLGGVQAVITFDNTYGGDKGLYELAVLGIDGHLTYSTPITNDVIGYLRDIDVTDVMEKIQQLPNGE